MSNNVTAQDLPQESIHLLEWVAYHVEHAKTLVELTLSPEDTTRLVLADVAAIESFAAQLKKFLVANASVAGMSIRPVSEAAGISTNTAQKWQAEGAPTTYPDGDTPAT